MMSLSQDLVNGLNKMNVYAQRAKLGAVIKELQEGGGGGGSEGDMKASIYATNDKSSIGFVDKAIFSERSALADNALVSDRAVLADKSALSDRATLADKSLVSDKALLSDKASVSDKAVLADNSLFSNKSGTSDVALLANLATLAEKSTTSESSDKLKVPIKLRLSGAVLAESEFVDGSSDILLTTQLSKTGAIIGSYSKVSIDEYGRVISGSSITVDDIPDIPMSRISDAGTSATKDIGTSPGNIPVLDQDGKIDYGILPAIAITETFIVSSEAEMLALSAQTGDVAIRNDLPASFILKGSNPRLLSDWTLLKTPTDAVLSVNGQDGVVNLTSADIGENSNLYYTEARATANFNTNIPKTKPSSLLDGNKLLTCNQAGFDVWIGTQEEYNSIVTKNPTTIYIVK